MDRKLATIFCADVVGYSRLMSADEEGTLRNLDQCRKIIDSMISDYGGRIFNTAGDSVLAEFEDPVQAVMFAAQCQAQLHQTNTMLWRMGINVGEVVVYNDTLMGDTINLAARIESQADLGGVGLSETVYQQVVDKITDIEFENRGPHEFKNIDRLITVYAIKVAGAKPNPHARVHRNRIYTHQQLLKMVAEDRVAATKTMLEAGGYRRNGSYEHAVRIYMTKVARKDLAAVNELIDMANSDLIPENLQDHVASVLFEFAKLYNSSDQYRIGCLLDSGNLGSENVAKAYAVWTLAAESDMDAAFALGIGTLKDPGSSKSEITQALQYLERAARKLRVGAAVRLGDYYMFDAVGCENNKLLAFQWYWVARHLKDAQSQRRLEQLTTKMSRGEVMNAKIIAESLVDDIKWQNSVR